MSLRNDVPYRITVEFKPPLSTKGQYNNLCTRLSGEHTALIGLTSQVGIFAIQFENASAGTLAAVKPGALIFKVGQGTKGPYSSAIIKSITAIADTKNLR